MFSMNLNSSEKSLENSNKSHLKTIIINYKKN